VRTALSLVVALTLACAKQQVAPVAQRSPEREARCRTVSDSIFANVPRTLLPDANPPKSGPPRFPLRVPLSVPAGMPVRLTFLVRPDGSGDTTTVAVTGTDDRQFKRGATKFVSRVAFEPARIDDCPVWSQITIVAVRSEVFRERPSGPPDMRTVRP